MKSMGIVRKVDELGRIVLPIELRKSLNIEVKDPLEIFTSNDKIILKKYEPADIFTGSMDNLIDYMGRRVSKESIKEMAKIAGFKLTEPNANQNDGGFNDKFDYTDDNFELDEVDL